jgi:hypothetical protein
MEGKIAFKSWEGNINQGCGTGNSIVRDVLL